MEFILSVFSGLFIALVIGTAIAFGFMILVWVIVAAVVITLCIYMREIIRRWIFLYNAAPTPPETPDVIEGEYKDLTD